MLQQLKNFSFHSRELLNQPKKKISEAEILISFHCFSRPSMSRINVGKNVLIPSLDISKVILSSRLRLSISFFYVILTFLRLRHSILSTALFLLFSDARRRRRKTLITRKGDVARKVKPTEEIFFVHFCNISTVTKKKLHLRPQKRRMRFVWFQIQIRCSLRAIVYPPPQRQVRIA